MNENMLGLKVVRVYNGYTDLLEINGNKSWISNVRDIRTELENVTNLDGTSAALMLTSLETGHLITVASWIDGRIGDCISAWIYVPATINVSGKELVDIIDAVKSGILADRLNDEQLREIFAKSYPMAQAKKITVQSSGDKCAFRYYGQRTKYTLAELLAEMCQREYKEYKSVFLLDNASNLKCRVGDNLTDQNVRPMIVIPAPGVVDNFVPHVNSEIFDKAICAIEGDELLVEWKRPGYSTIKKQIKAAKDVKCPVPTRNEHAIIIKYDLIQVFDDTTGNRLENYTLSINNQVIPEGKKVSISADIISKSKVEIKADGFDTYKGELDLRREQSVYLRKKRHAYKFVVVSKSGEKICLEYQIKGELETCPIQGYVPIGKELNPNIENGLKYRPYSTTFKSVLAIAMVIMLGLGFAGGWFLNSYLNADVKKETVKPEETTNVKEEPKEENQEAQLVLAPEVLEMLIQYLDEKNEWIRTDMEEIGADDLWDCLNEYKFDEILKYKEELNKSKNFANIIIELEKRKDTTNLKKFNPEGDPKITLENYLKRIESLKELPQGDGPVAAKPGNN
jgi:hypothetical protein